VRGLLWRSHPSWPTSNEEQNLHLGEVVNAAGGEILLDERVRGPGSQHQKLVLIRHPDREDDDVAFMGGIDLCHGRRDDERHLGDPQAVPMDERYGDHPPWHDVQLEVRGPAVGDLSVTFRERWEDPTPLDHRNPWRARRTRRVGQPGTPARCRRCCATRPRPAPTPSRCCAPTRPSGRRCRSRPTGERSIARAYLKALWRPGRLIYLEDQYLWSEDIAQAPGRRPAPLARAAADRGRPPLPRPGRPHERPANRIGQQAALTRCGRPAATGSPSTTSRTSAGTPDLRARQGVRDRRRVGGGRLRQPEPALLDPRQRAVGGGAGRDPGRAGARATRPASATAPGCSPGSCGLRLWREHLGRGPGEDGDLLDPVEGFEAWRRAASALTGWHEAGRRGPRPPGHASEHDPGRVQALGRLVGHARLQAPGRPRRPPPAACRRRAGRF
jgi:hypothetical protein